MRTLHTNTLYNNDNMTTLVRPFYVEQSGEGIGNLLSSLIRYAVPFLRNPIVQHTAKQVVPALGKVVGDVVQGKPLKRSLKKRGSAAVTNILTSYPYAKIKRRKRNPRIDGFFN